MPTTNRSGLAVLVAAGLLVLSAGRVAGVEPEPDRGRKVRVALALSAGGGGAAAATAPAPRAAAGRLAYPEGYAKATLDQAPLVVFVGCDGHRVEGAVVARADALGDVRGPAVVVGFPRGDRVFVDATLPCPVDAGKLDAAVRAAARKIEGTPPAKPMPAAPVPLDWQIRADPPKDDAHAVYVERKDTGDVLEWTQTGPKGEVTWVWTTAAGVKATEELAAALVKQKLCEAGRCPLLPVKVRLVPKRKFD